MKEEGKIKRTGEINCDEGRGGKQRGGDEELTMKGKVMGRGRRLGRGGKSEVEERKGGEEERNTDIPHTHGKPLTSNNKFEPLYPS